MIASLCMTCLLLSSAATGEREFQKAVTFQLTREEDSQYRLHSRTQMTSTCPDEPGGDEGIEFVDPFYAPIRNIELDLRKQGKKRFKTVKDVVTSSYSPELEDIFFHDLRIIRLDTKQRIQPGQDVRIRYQQTYRSPTFLPVLEIPNTDDLTTFTLVFHHPNDVTVDFEFYFAGKKVDYELVREPDQTHLTFTRIPPRPAVSGYPFNGTHVFILTRLLAGDTYLGGSSPHAFNQWYQTLMGEIPALEETNRQLVASLTAEHETPREKVRALFDYVKTEIRYLADEVALGAIVPRPPNRVLARKYGDCKDKALLVREMARSLGLEVEIALVSTTPTPDFGESVRFDMFNHVICAWKDEAGQWLFFDPTQPWYTFGSVPDTLIGKRTFLIGPDLGQWVTVPNGKSKPDMEIVVHADVAHPDDGRATIHLRGDLRAAAAEAMAQMRQLDRENMLAGLVAAPLRKLAVREFSMTREDGDEAVFQAQANLEKYLMISPRKLYVPGTAFTLVDGALLDRRGDDLAIYNEANLSLVFTLHLRHTGFLRPDHRLLMGDPRWASFQADIEGDDNLSIITYRYTQQGRAFTGESRAALLEFCADYLQHKNDMFVFPKTQP